MEAVCIESGAAAGEVDPVAAGRSGPDILARYVADQLARGRGQLICLPEAALMAYLKSGQIRPLAVKQPEVAQRLLALGSVAESGMGVAAFDSFMRSARERWSQIVKSIGVVPE